MSIIVHTIVKKNGKNMTHTPCKEARKEVQEQYEKLGHYTTIISEQEGKPIKEGLLSGYGVTIKDGINVLGVETTAGSAILDGYKPLFDATVIEKVRNQGGDLIAKTSQDAFGFGSFSTSIGQGKLLPKNPLDTTRTCGGSSGGCAGSARSLKAKHVSIAESTGGSIVCPASFCGVVGLCPTYGRVSRYGLIDYGNSLDKIGPIATNVHDTALLLEVMAGYDEKDSTTMNVPVDNYSKMLNKPINGIKIGVIEETFGQGVMPEIESGVRKSIEYLKQKGATIETVSLPITTQYALYVYYILAFSEASTNLAKYCGMRYGRMSEPSGKSFNEYFTDIRSQFFEKETKRRVILGTFVRMAGFRDAYYIKAAKVRTLIINEYKELFKKYDVLISPTMPVIAPRFDDIAKMKLIEAYKMDIMTVGPNLAGVPHMTIPTGTIQKMPFGTMLIANHFEEAKMLNIASILETMPQIHTD